MTVPRKIRGTPASVRLALVFSLAAVALFAVGDAWLLETRLAYYQSKGLATMATVVALNVALLAWIVLVLTILLGRVLAALMVASAIYLLLAVTSRLKLANLGEPLLPWDYLSVSQFAGMSKGYLGLDAASATALGLAAVAGAGALWLLFRESPLPRAKAAVAAVLLPIPFYWLYFVAEPLRRPLGLTNITWSQATNVRSQGLLNHLAMNLRTALVLAPARYGHDAVRASCGPGDVPAASSASVDTGAGRRPHVIVVLNEAFTRVDLTLAGRVKFDTELTPFFSSLRPTPVSVPTFGGLTANAEFEILTGTPMALLPNGSIPFLQYIHRPLPNSLPRLFARAGYRPLALHPFVRTFWNRDVVFGHMGFERFIAIEDLRASAGPPYIRDAALIEPIMGILDASDRPVFLFVTTMENHGPWFEARYEALDVAVVSVPDGWSALARQALANYAQGVRNGDAFLRALAARLAGRDDVVIAMFGDHHPTIVVPDMGTHNLMSARFSDIGRSLPPSHDQRAVLQTEIAFWPGSVSLAPESQLTLLGPALARRAGIPLDGYWSAVERVGARHPSLQRQFASSPDGGWVPLDRGEGVETIRLLQYDALFGKQYAATACAARR